MNSNDASISRIQNDIDLLTGHVRSYLGPLKSKKLNVNGVEYQYLEGGSGVPVLFLHGMGSSKSQARSILQGLTPNYRVISPDVPGFSWGTSLPQNKRHTLKNLSVWLDGFLKALKINEIHIVGHSSGAAVAAYYGSSYQSKVSSLFLMGTPDLKIAEGDHENMWDKFIEFEVTSAEDMNDLTKRFFYYPISLPSIASKMYIRNFRDHKEVYQAVLKDLSESASLLYSRVSRISCPVILARGEHDEFCSESNQEFLKRAIPNAESMNVYKTSHFFFLEKPKVTVRLVEDLMNRPQKKNLYQESA